MFFYRFEFNVDNNLGCSLPFLNLNMQWQQFNNKKKVFPKTIEFLVLFYV